MRQVLTLVIIAICFLASGCAQNSNSASLQLQQLFADDWEFAMREYPLFATHTGDHRFNDRLPAVSEADQKRRLAQKRIFLKHLHTIDRSALNAEEQLNYDIFECLTEDSIAGDEFRIYLMPINQMGGFHSHFPQLHERVPLNMVEDYENYIARLNAFKSYTDEHIKLMRTGMELGITPPRVVLNGIEDSIKPHIVDEPEESLLFGPFKKFPKTFSEIEQQNLTRAGREAIMNSVVPGYKALLEFVSKEYLPAARSDIAASSLPNGKAYYEYCVRHHTTLDITPQQVHDIGLAEVKRIRAEMDKLISEIGFEGDFNDFREFLHSDERFYVDTAEQLLKETAFVLKKIDCELPKLFETLPRTPFGLKEVPDYIAHRAAGAYYWSPSGDGTVAGTYYINTYDLKSRPLYTLEVLALHEAMPGHHLQMALQQERKDIPNFRCYSGFSSYGEGWALYAEGLGSEMGLYQDPYSNFGRLAFEMWRACRLVVDTGMHYMGWSRQQAIDFMRENTTSSAHNITTEVDRYIVWPGQALAYKMGELKIRELRKRAEQKLGKDFNIRQFHSVTLSNGPVPLDVLERNGNIWLAEQNH